MLRFGHGFILRKDIIIAERPCCSWACGKDMEWNLQRSEPKMIIFTLYDADLRNVLQWQLSTQEDFCASGFMPSDVLLECGFFL